MSKLFHTVVLLGLILVSLAVYSQTKVVLDAPPPKKVLVLGDSLSAAYKLPATQGWVHLLQQRLREYDVSTELVNASVSGATTAAGLQILPGALAAHVPDMVIVELGANDGLQGKPVSYIRKNLQQLIEKSQAGGAKVVLLGVRLPPNFGARYAEPFFAQYASLAEQYDAVLVPFMLDGVAGQSAFMMGDGLHPNATGQVRVLENIWEVLAPYLLPASVPGDNVGN